MKLKDVLPIIETLKNTGALTTKDILVVHTDLIVVKVHGDNTEFFDYLEAKNIEHKCYANAGNPSSNECIIIIGLQ